MILVVDAHSGIPVYRQIMEQIRFHVSSGPLGRNGSGKTTLLHHLMGLLLPSEGSAATLGRSADKLGHDELIRIGFVPQEFRLLVLQDQSDLERCALAVTPQSDTGRTRRA
jgi:ABC-type multidrug transport system ATPase subunit